MSIRRAEFVDFPELYNLMSQLMYKNPPDRAKMESAYREALGDPTVKIAVFDDGQEIVGMISVSVHHTLHHFGWVALIDEMVVSERARRRGVGKTLVDWAKAEAKNMGADTLELHSAEYRKDAYAFYQSLGFERISYVFSANL
jgi:ribosomal protein S18 acetylase RimI-like enzyme